VKPADVRELFDAMREAGHKAGVRRALHWRLKAIFRYAVNIGWLGAGREGYVTVMDSIEPPRGSSQQRAHINREQALAFIAAAQESGSRYADAFEVLLRTGARKGELLAIRWEDVDLEAGWLTISGSLKRTRVADHYGTVLVRGDTKTASSNREVLIDADIAAALERQRVHQEAERLAAGKRWRDSGLVFTSTTGGPVEFSHFNSAFKSLADKVLPGVGFVPHGARHTVATLQATKMMQQTGRVLTPEEWASIGATLGHRDGTITKNVYGHLSEELEREARRANAKALGSAL
jgi:integrase